MGCLISLGKHEDKALVGIYDAASPKGGMDEPPNLGFSTGFHTEVWVRVRATFLELVNEKQKGKDNGARGVISFSGFVI